MPYKNREDRLRWARDKYARDERTRELFRRRRNKNRKRNPIKERARRQVSLAIEKGILIRMPCEKCGENKSQAHHEDYTKSLKVTWLCVKHHGERHRTNI